MDIDTIIKTMINLNPYPEDIFSEPTKDEYDYMRKVLKDNGLMPDKFFGSWGRKVWNNCVNDFDDYLREVLEE